MARRELPKLSTIDFGFDDANQEYVAALREGGQPAYINAFVDINGVDLPKLKSGSKWLVHGLKGTGKTALLRNAAETQDVESEYIVFRDEINTEEELSKEVFPVIIEERSLHNKQHYLHVMKRILLSIILTKAKSEINEKDLKNYFGDKIPKKLKETIFAKTVNGALETAFETISALASSVRLDPKKLLPDGINVDFARLLKSENSRILGFFCENINKPIRIYVDEVNFAYKEADAYRSDAILVRDLILAINSLNTSFAKRNVDVIVYLGIRTEFLEHPVISSAEVSNVVNAIGQQMSWTTYPYNNRHPIYDVIAKRIAVSTGVEIDGHNISGGYLANVGDDQFLRLVYGKPREAVRFFNIAKQMFGNKTTLLTSDFSAAAREFSNQSWRDMRASLASFMSEENLLKLTALLRKFASSSFERDITYKEASDEIKLIWANFDSAATVKDFEHFMHVLFVIGIYSTRYKSSNGEILFHSYYRGSHYASFDGDFVLSDAILRHLK